ncbi:MAG: toast rack family protein [Aggregatilineales bacterium]
MRIWTVIFVMLLLAACRSAGGEETQTISVDFPENGRVNLALEMTAGNLSLQPTAEGGLTGTINTNVRDWRPSVETTGDTIRIRQGRAAVSVIPDARNTWSLGIGPLEQLNLTIEAGAAEVTAQLGGLPLNELSLQGTTRPATLNFDQLADYQGGRGMVTLTTGAFTANSLFNTTLRELNVTTTGGRIELNFDGSPRTTPLLVRLETRSGITLIGIPANVNASVTYNTSSGNVREVDPQYEQINRTTWIVGDPDEEPILIIELRSVVGDLRLVRIR